MFRTTILAISVALSASASTFQLVTNGGFESGLSGWASTETVASPGTSCATLWTIANNGSATNCQGISNPNSGTLAAYTSFDGYGAGNGSSYTQVQNYRLVQSIVVPTGQITAATLSFEDTFSVYVCSCYTPPVLPRTFHIDIKDGQGGLLANLYTRQFVAGTSTEASPWTTFSMDVTTALQSLVGQTVRLEIIATIPQYFTGSAGFGLDDVALSVTTATAPEPGTYGLLLGGLGFIALRFRRKSTLARPDRQDPQP